MVLRSCAVICWVILFFTVALTSARDFEELAKPDDFEDGFTTETTAYTFETTTTDNLETITATDTPNDEEEPPVNYKGAQVLRVEITNKAQKKLVKTLFDKNLIDIWFSRKGKKRRYDFMVMPENLEMVKKRFRELNVTTSVFINDVQARIASENPLIRSYEEKDGAKATAYALNWDSYSQYGAIHDFLDYYATKYPDICKVQTIGRTAERRDMKLLTISSGGATKRPAIFIDGGMHAREWISPATVTYIIRELVENRTNYGSFVSDVDYHIIPLVNVDGYEHTHKRNRMWRKNRADLFGFCNGVDLNRNFGHKWGGSGSSLYNYCSNVYAGNAAFSEPESEAIRDYILAASPGLFKGYISFHSYGQVMLYPWGYTTELTPDSDDLKNVSKTAADAIKKIGGAPYTYGSTGGVLYRASGNSADWARGAADIKYSYVVELPDKGRYGFALPSKYIKPTGRDSMEIVKAVAEAILRG